MAIAVQAFFRKGLALTTGDARIDLNKASLGGLVFVELGVGTSPIVGTVGSCRQGTVQRQNDVASRRAFPLPTVAVDTLFNILRLTRKRSCITLLYEEKVPPLCSGYVWRD